MVSDVKSMNLPLGIQLIQWIVSQKIDGEKTSRRTRFRRKFLEKAVEFIIVEYAVLLYPLQCEAPV